MVVGGSGGVRAKMTGTGGKDGTGLSPLPSGLQHCCRLIGDFPFDVPYSGGWQLVFGKSAASQSMWIRSELIMGDPFWVRKPLYLRIRMFE